VSWEAIALRNRLLTTIQSRVLGISPTHENFIGRLAVLLAAADFLTLIRRTKDMTIRRLLSVRRLPLILRAVWIFSFLTPANPLVAATINNYAGLEIAVKSDKQTFLLGEPVSLTFQVANSSNTPLALPGLIEVRGAHLALQIAYEGGPYRLYNGPGWYVSGRRTRTPPTLHPGGSIETTATVLHNRAPKRSDLNEERWKIVTEREIDTEIAFPKPGRYRLKAILFGKIESLPLEIRVAEPQTFDDIEVWKVISSQPKYALFMQSGDLSQGTLTDRENKEFVDALEKFINYHATSTYTPHF
jgi:hypothetical protein